ncbi:MAG: hypothetical protein K1X89_07825 [Myxococcaceae bacterium]|nr:hypothetical protein [Myxococcaceae bacterium]
MTSAITRRGAAPLAATAAGPAPRPTEATNTPPAPPSSRFETTKRAPAAANPRDVSSTFEALYQSAKAGTLTLPADADQYVYLMVPGFVAPKSALKPNQEALLALGLDARMSTDPELEHPVNVKASVGENAEALAASIAQLARETGKQVIPIVHSSGAPELHQALIDHPELRAQVHCAIALDGTYGGTPLAERYENLKPVVKHAVDALAAKAGIDPQGITDVVEGNREAYLRAHPFPSDVLAFNVAASFNHGFSFLKPLVALLRKDSPGGASDGMVPTANQTLPGQPVAYLGQADHSDLITHRPFSKQSPEAITLAAVSFALTEAAR